MTQPSTGGAPPIQSGPSAQLASNAADRDRDAASRSESGAPVSPTMSEAREHAGDLMHHAKEHAAKTLDAVKDKARDIADEQKRIGADKIQGVASVLRGAGEDLEKQIPGAAGFARDAAQGIERFSSSLRNRSVDELVSSFNTFARTQPVAFFGAAVLAGFALSRFLKSSADHGHGHSTTPPSAHSGQSFQSNQSGPGAGVGRQSGVAAQSSSTPSGEPYPASGSAHRTDAGSNDRWAGEGRGSAYGMTASGEAASHQGARDDRRP
jgi:hypothetical protein